MRSPNPPQLLKELEALDINDLKIIEDLISGRGLAKIYLCLSGSKKSPEEIIGAYKVDEYAQKTIDLFFIHIKYILVLNRKHNKAVIVFL